MNAKTKLGEIITKLMPSRAHRAREGTEMARMLLRSMSRNLPIAEDQLSECRKIRDDIAKSKDARARPLNDMLTAAQKTGDSQVVEIAVNLAKDYLAQDAKGKLDLAPKVFDFLEVCAGWKS